MTTSTTEKDDLFKIHTIWMNRRNNLIDSFPKQKAVKLFVEMDMRIAALLDKMYFLGLVKIKK